MMALQFTKKPGILGFLVWRGNGVVSAGCPWITTKDAGYGEPTGFKEGVNTKTFHGEAGAGRFVSAPAIGALYRGNKGRNRALVDPDQDFRQVSRSPVDKLEDAQHITVWIKLAASQVESSAAGQSAINYERKVMNSYVNGSCYPRMLKR
jgi:hypothetical protein